MLSIKEDVDGKYYHIQLRYNEEADCYEEGDWILNSYGDKIPSTICLCYAYKPSECCCGTTSWDNYDWDYGYDF